MRSDDNGEIDSDKFIDAIFECMGYGSHYTGDDELYADTLKLVKGMNHISSSVLQRRFRIGYARATRLMGRLEDEGVISTLDNNGKRKVAKR